MLCSETVFYDAWEVGNALHIHTRYRYSYNVLSLDYATGYKDDVFFYCVYLFDSFYHNLHCQNLDRQMCIFCSN